MISKFSAIFLLGSILSIGLCEAQKAKIFLETEEVVSVISAVSKTEIFTESGNIPISKIEKILFEKFDPRYENTYAKLGDQIKLEYGDGTDLGDISQLTKSLSEDKSPEGMLEQNVFIKIDSINLSKEELYAKAKSYIAYSYKSAQDVIQLDDKENGKIVTKGNFRTIIKSGLINLVGIINFTFTIDLRDGKFRGIIEDLYHDGWTIQPSIQGGSFTNEKPSSGTLQIPISRWEKVKDQGRIDAVSYLEDFSNYMKSKSKIDDF